GGDDCIVLRLGRIHFVLHSVRGGDLVDHLDVGELAVVGVRDLEAPAEHVTGLDAGRFGPQHHADARAVDSVGRHGEADLHVPEADVGQVAVALVEEPHPHDVGGAEHHRSGLGRTRGGGSVDGPGGLADGDFGHAGNVDVETLVTEELLESQLGHDLAVTVDDPQHGRLRRL